jgi:hypothetical protein
MSSIGVTVRLSDYIVTKGYKLTSIAAGSGVNYDTLWRCVNGVQQMTAEDFMKVCLYIEKNPMDFAPPRNQT